MTVELGREEAHAPHLALRDDVDAGVLLVAQGGVDRVVLHLAHVARAELTALGGGHGQLQPAGTSMRSADRGGQGLGAEGLGHRRPPGVRGIEPPGWRVSGDVEDGPATVDGDGLSGDRARLGREKV